MLVTSWGGRGSYTESHESDGATVRSDPKCVAAEHYTTCTAGLRCIVGSIALSAATIEMHDTATIKVTAAPYD